MMKVYRPALAMFTTLLCIGLVTGEASAESKEPLFDLTPLRYEDMVIFGACGESICKSVGMRVCNEHTSIIEIAYNVIETDFTSNSRELKLRFSGWYLIKPKHCRVVYARAGSASSFSYYARAVDNTAEWGKEVGFRKDETIAQQLAAIEYGGLPGCFPQDDFDYYAENYKEFTARKRDQACGNFPRYLTSTYGVNTRKTTNSYKEYGQQRPAEKFGEQDQEIVVFTLFLS